MDRYLIEMQPQAVEKIQCDCTKRVT